MSRAAYHGGVAETWRAAEKAHRRARYLDAAGHLFAARGYRAVSIDDLGAAVGVSGPALYKHFASKEAMLIELLVGASERLVQGYESTVAAGGESAQTLRDLIAFHLDFALAERDIIRIQDRELATLPDEANRRVRSLQRRYVDGWKEIVTRIRPDISATTLEVRMHAVFGILNSTPRTAGDEPVAEMREELAEMAFAALTRERGSVGSPRGC